VNQKPKFVGFIFIAVAAAALALWVQHGSKPTTVPSSPSAPRGGLESGVAQHAEVLLRARAAREDAIVRADKLIASLDNDFQHERRRFETDIEPLLANDAGKAIAGNCEELPGFIDAFESVRITPEEVAATRERVSALRALVRKENDNSESKYEPDTKTLGDLSAYETAAERALDSYRIPRERIEAILRRSKGAPATATRSIPLREAVTAYRDDIEWKASCGATETKRAKLNRDLADLDAERRRREELRLKAHDPEVQRKLTPILAPNRRRLRGGSYRRGEHPMALNDLRKAGALDNPDQFARVLGRGSRSMGGRYVYGARTLADLDKMKEVHGLLVSLADTLVEECLILLDAGEGAEEEPIRIERCRAFYARKKTERSEKESELEEQLREQLAALPSTCAPRETLCR
jgi:hypothetical protein